MSDERANEPGNPMVDATARTLGDTFYQGEEAGALRPELQAAEGRMRQELAEGTGIHDTALLDRLVALGIRAETLAALTLVPLVEVAWADGHMDAKERDAILAGAESTGIGRESLSYALLRIWTHDRPPSELFDVWSQFVTALAAELQGGERAAFREKILGRARAVAEAAGGFLGLGSRVSASEEATLTRLDAALGDA